MYEHSAEFSVARMAKVLEVSESGYHKWAARLHMEANSRKVRDDELLAEILEIYRDSRGSYGSRKVTAKLNKDRQTPFNHKRVERIMHENGLRSKTSRTYVCTTDSDHDLPVADNLINRDFTAKARGEKMVSDTTVVSTGEGKLYIAGILDLYGRMPTGLAMGCSNDRFLVMDALDDMLIRGCAKPGCIIHSDRGSTYASDDYRRMLKDNGLICSMSRKGDCWDNAPMESFWGKLKSEWLKKKYATIDEAKRDVYKYIWEFYPYMRPHEALSYQTPAQYYQQGNRA